MNKAFIDFVKTHEHEDTVRLLLSAARYADIDMPTAVHQIEGRRTAREKWPRLLSCDEYLYPPRLNREQASSEATARYKAVLLDTKHYTQNTVCDLTGGMGIDSLALASVSRHVDYVERDAALCELMEHNCSALGIDNISVHCADSLEWLSQAGHYDLIFIDPARRSAAGRKVAAFEDCTPNLLEGRETLREHGDRLMVKASPMIDIDLGVAQLGCVSEVHVVALKGECKEVLFVGGEPQGEPQIVCIDIKNEDEIKTPQGFAFTRSQEAAAEAHLCSTVSEYLYEPDATLMKGGPFKLLCRLGVDKLAPNTHLYTAPTLLSDFPGRVFRVLSEVPLNRKAVRTMLPEGKAHVVVRNFPVAAADLQRQLGLGEGGSLFLVATTVGFRRAAFLCRRIK